MTERIRITHPKEDKARILLNDLEDTMWDALTLHNDLNCDLEDEYDKLIYNLRAFWCKIKDHNPVPDQCGTPAHDYCIVCGDLTPNQASRP